MDNAMLVPVVMELRESLVGSRLGDVVQIDSRRFALRFDDPPFHRVAVSLHPDAGALHLVRRAPTPDEPTALAVALTGSLGGKPLKAIHKDPAERVVEMEFGDGWTPESFLVVELLGKSSNLLLLDGERRILRYLRAHRGAFRRPEEGVTYQPPRPARTAARLPFGSRLLGREVETLSRRGEDSSAARRRIEERMEEARWEPVLYTPAPPEELEEADPLDGETAFASPFPVCVGEGLHARRHDSPSAAVAELSGLLHRHLLFKELRSSLISLLAKELGRMQRLLTALDAEAQRAAGSEATRRTADLLLASLATARKEGDRVEVVDYFDPQTPRVRIAIDPSLDLRANAERMFRRARKQERAALAVAERRRQTAERLEGARKFSAELEAAASAGTLMEIEERMNRSGLLRVARRPGRRSLGRKPGTMRLKEYRTTDGHVVLVGRGAADNDTLTFKVAAPHDFWLHAAGRSGAHVVVRNPRRLKTLPEAAMREAAAIAAWFSRGDRETPVDIHFTKRKEVRKGKGMSPGMVMLRQYRTLRVKPAPPAGQVPGAGGARGGGGDDDA